MSLAIVACLLFQVQLTDGPGVHLSAVEGMKPHEVKVSGSWVAGCYAVTFIYRTEKSVSALADLCKKEEGIEYKQDMPAHSRFTMDRRMGGVFQRVTVQRNVMHYVQSGPEGRIEGKKTDPYTTVIVDEHVDLGSSPLRYYRGAYSEKPPVELIDVPFLDGVKACAVSLTSFDELMSSKGMMFPDVRDAQVFSALVPGDWEAVREKAAAWGRANGYVETRMYWFKPKVRMFEFLVLPHAQGASVTMWCSDREALHPIALEKN